MKGRIMTNKNSYDIYGLGAALVDTEIEVTEVDLRELDIDKGVMTLVDEERQSDLMGKLSDHLKTCKRASGGSAANSIIAASYFGARTWYSCKVADDENGLFYLHDLAEAGVNFRQQEREPGTTGKCLVMITPDAERTMNTYLGISELLSVDDIDEDALKASTYAYIEGYLVTSATGLPAASRLKHLANKHGVTTALSLSDPAIVQYFREGLLEIIGDSVDILFCNEAEALNFTQTSSLDEAKKALGKHTKTWAITRGAKGALVFDGKSEYEIAPYKVKAVDSNGAGDMFAGAFLYGLTQNMGYERAGQLASKAASIVVSQYGPRLQAEQHKEILDEFR